MVSLSRPEFAWLMNGLRRRSLEFKAQVWHVSCSAVPAVMSARCSTANKFKQTGFILLRTLLLHQLMNLEHFGSHWSYCYKTSFAVRNDLNKQRK